MLTLQTITGIQQTITCNCAKCVDKSKVVTRHYIIKHKGTGGTVTGKLVSHVDNCRSSHIFQMLNLSASDWTVMNWSYSF